MGFPFHWSTGEDKLMIVSVGTGYQHTRYTVQQVMDDRIWNWAKKVPTMLMDDANWQNQLLMQCMSRTPTPFYIDMEVGNAAMDQLSPEPLLHYIRYDIALETNALQALGLTRDNGFDPEDLYEMSRGSNAQKLTSIGEKAAIAAVQSEHFPDAFDLPNRSDLS